MTHLLDVSYPHTREWRRLVAQVDTARGHSGGTRMDIGFTSSTRMDIGFTSSTHRTGKEF
jgi:hypothetical protein